jgi:hypothetical protein
LCNPDEATLRLVEATCTPAGCKFCKCTCSMLVKQHQVLAQCMEPINCCCGPILRRWACKRVVHLCTNAGPKDLCPPQASPAPASGLNGVYTCC